MDTEGLDFNLPQEYIAQYPLLERSEAKLFIYERKAAKVYHARFSQIKDFLCAGDLLVLNDSGVKKTRLYARRKSGGRIEIFILRRVKDSLFKVMLRPLKRLKLGEELILEEGKCKIVDLKEGLVEFLFPVDEGFFDKYAKIPLPPYIKREPVSLDEEYYQTVYFKEKGSLASPTAGLHFDEHILNSLADKGVHIDCLTLHIGKASFRLLKEEDLARDRWDEEYYRIPPTLLDRIRKKDYTKLVACGTSTVRALESFALTKNFEGFTSLFIKEGFKFKLTQALITNFHHPRSSHILLVSSFVGSRNLLFGLYQEALKNNYRFLSYGDAMLII